MCIKNLNKSAFSLLEILLASVIFVITTGGLFVTLSAVRRPVADKESALIAAVFGKQVLEALRSYVDGRSGANYYTTDASCSAGSCTDFSLALGTHYVSPSVLSTATGLSWPTTALSNQNSCSTPSIPSSCLVYTVSCSDGSTNNCASNGNNPDIARRVDLNINWPSAT